MVHSFHLYCTKFSVLSWLYTGVYASASSTSQVPRLSSALGQNPSVSSAVCQPSQSIFMINNALGSLISTPVSYKSVPPGLCGEWAVIEGELVSVNPSGFVASPSAGHPQSVGPSKPAVMIGSEKVSLGEGGTLMVGSSTVVPPSGTPSRASSGTALSNFAPPATQTSGMSFANTAAMTYNSGFLSKLAPSKVDSSFGGTSEQTSSRSSAGSAALESSSSSNFNPASNSARAGNSSRDFSRNGPTSRGLSSLGFSPPVSINAPKVAPSSQPAAGQSSSRLTSNAPNFSFSPSSASAGASGSLVTASITNSESGSSAVASSVSIQSSSQTVSAVLTTLSSWPSACTPIPITSGSFVSNSHVETTDKQGHHVTAPVVHDPNCIVRSPFLHEDAPGSFSRSC